MPKKTKNSAPWCIKGAEGTIDEMIFYIHRGWDMSDKEERQNKWTEEQKVFREYTARVFSEITRIWHAHGREKADQFAADVGQQWKIFAATFG